MIDIRFLKKGQEQFEKLPESEKQQAKIDQTKK